MFSATFSNVVQNWAREWLRETHVMVSNKKNSANTKVIQSFIKVSEFEKNDKLLNMLKEELEEEKKKHACKFLKYYHNCFYFS